MDMFMDTGGIQMNKSDKVEIVQNLREVRDSGAVNMLDKSGVVNELCNAGYDFSAEQVGNMSPHEYIETLKEI